MAGRSKKGLDALPGARGPYQAELEGTQTAEWPESTAYLEARTGEE